MAADKFEQAQEQMLSDNSPRRLAGFSAYGGGGAGEESVPAYTLLCPRTCSLPVVISVPHAGRAYTPALLTQMRNAERAALMLEDRFVDRLGEAIALEIGATLLIAEAPRALIDLNRAPDDIDWSMIAETPASQKVDIPGNRRARSGLGLIPRKLARLGEIWQRKITFDDLSRRLEVIHFPYHAALARLLQETRDRWGAALLIDLHSMPPVMGGRLSLPAPQVVVGDRFGGACAADLSALALNKLGRSRPVAHNMPYAGGYILERHGAPERNIHAMQLEICRTTYLDQDMRQIGIRFPAIAREIAALIIMLGEEIAWLGRPQSTLAAE